MISTIVIKTLATKLFSYSMGKLKNTQFARDLKDKWVRDNYHKTVTEMFEAAIVDAQRAVSLPDDLITDLITDEDNRTEIFRWIIEGVSEEKFTVTKLNLDPYMEIYPQYQDRIPPFFQVILTFLFDFRSKNSQLEFLQIISKIDLLENTFREGLTKIEDTLQTNHQITQKSIDQNTNFLKDIFVSPGYDDLKELINSGDIISARDRAFERLRRPNLSRDDYLEINLIIANSYLNGREQTEALPFLYSSLSYCEDPARHKRLETIIKLLSDDKLSAEKSIRDAISYEGETIENIKLLVEVYKNMENYDTALKILEDGSVQYFV